MESRIKNLIEKYWNSESSLDEEQEIKDYFNQHPSLTPEGLYFRKLDRRNAATSDVDFSHPAKKWRRSWAAGAAAAVVGIGIAVMVLIDAGNQKQYAVKDPKEALEITRKALLMVSSGIHEGKKYTENITKINEAEDLLKDSEL